MMGREWDSAPRHTCIYVKVIFINGAAAVYMMLLEATKNFRLLPVDTVIAA